MNSDQRGFILLRSGRISSTWRIILLMKDFCFCLPLRDDASDENDKNDRHEHTLLVWSVKINCDLSTRAWRCPNPRTTGTCSHPQNSPRACESWHARHVSMLSSMMHPIDSATNVNFSDLVRCERIREIRRRKSEEIHLNPSLGLLARYILLW